MRARVLTTLILLLTLFSLSLAAQRPTPPPPNPPPPVPLDGGLIALIGAGAALGYKKYKARQE